MDHRGTPQTPGLVATMLTEEQHAAIVGGAGGDASGGGDGGDGEGDGDAGVCGVCYLISDADAAEVLDALDFREKGGYTRELIDVTPSDKSLPPVRALLYTATPDNPNFDPGAVMNMAAAAELIACTVGPSGPNCDYLLALATFLEEQGERDAHVEYLSGAVRRHLAEAARAKKE